MMLERDRQKNFQTLVELFPGKSKVTIIDFHCEVHDSSNKIIPYKEMAVVTNERREGNEIVYKSEAELLRDTSIAKKDGDRFIYYLYGEEMTTPEAYISLKMKLLIDGKLQNIEVSKKLIRHWKFDIW